MNMIQTTCKHKDCEEPILISIDELRMFNGGVCAKHDSPTAKHIRHKAVMDYYGLPPIKSQMLDKLIEKEFKDVVRR